ncbi:hypothetical protein GKZ89_01715 [Bacillus mangrovi]|uniref:Isoprenylcysteine carboxyl methyltransferase n=1 Tax=Metabacillus mangrovi TaxID=1491830 RepID=A0A7X2S2P3_9BACI|nr:isoprenylcysteine carboxylmethyltransferase family protein [Metabacillus mangrovi]MTH52106.1 hypothetical protein [Metabacillus mangrovi]
MIPILLITILILQRISELGLARKNEKVSKGKGGIEYGKSHYPYMVSMHTAFLLALAAEALFVSEGLSPYWMILVPLIFLTQYVRYWAIRSLGSSWNTKIILLPEHDVTVIGPYRYFRHPNYAVVAAEILLIPLLFQAYITAIVFTVLNAAMLTVRIRAEEKALKEHSDYLNAFRLRKNQLKP